MNVAVTGASGFVGKKLVMELLNQGHEVTGVVRRKELLSDIICEKLSIIECDFEDYDKLACQISKKKEMDVFFHLAWSGTSGDERGNTKTQMNNVIIAEKAVNQAYALGCKRFVYAGSIMEYEAIAYINKENTLPGQGYIYSTGKLAADNISKITAQKLGMKYINTVISNIYGEGEKSARFLNTIIRKMIKNEDIDMTEGKQLYDFIYINDGVKAMILAGCYGKAAQYYYIGNSKQRPLYEFVDEAKRVVGSSSKVKLGAVPYNGPYLTFNEINTHILYDEFGFSPKVTFESGVSIIRRSEDEISNFGRWS